jgi:hypothetical protein
MEDFLLLDPILEPIIKILGIISLIRIILLEILDLTEVVLPPICKIMKKNHRILRKRKRTREKPTKRKRD